MRYGFAALKFGGTPEEFGKIKALPPQNSLFSYSTPKEILYFDNLSMENFMVPQPGVRYHDAIGQKTGIGLIIDQKGTENHVNRGPQIKGR